MSKQPDSMSAQEYQAQFGSTPDKGQKRPKYGAKRADVGDISFDSKKEAGRWQELQTLLRAGEITELRRQVAFGLTVNGELVTTYKADFVYRDKAGERIVEDSKGFPTEEYKIKRRFMAACHGIIIKES